MSTRNNGRERCSISRCPAVPHSIDGANVAIGLVSRVDAAATQKRTGQKFARKKRDAPDARQIIEATRFARASGSALNPNMPTIHPLPATAGGTTTPHARPDFGPLVREALGYHGAVTFDHLLRCLPLWRPATWFPKRWPERVRRVLKCDPKIEEIKPGIFRLRSSETGD